MRGATREAIENFYQRGISIHAPHAGCDSITDVIAFHAPNFNPRTPCGVRLKRALHPADPLPFQSTHPMRGATPEYAPLPEHDPISIHAPHAGCDLHGHTHHVGVSLFQSTHPMRGATKIWHCCAAYRQHFNPRTPCGVRRPGVIRLCGVVSISIHAPHAGCDQNLALLCRLSSTFQSTHPMRGATLMKMAILKTATISIHAPHAGCDRYSGSGRDNLRNFNPRTPCGVRHELDPAIFFPIGISIHAPHAGCDDDLPAFSALSHCISIHAPHAGCDDRMYS